MGETSDVPGRGRVVTDYRGLCEGDTDPTHCKPIHSLILKTKDCIVYLDDTFELWWALTEAGSAHWQPEWDRIINEVSVLDAEPSDGLVASQLQSYRRMLGEAVARVIDDGNVREAAGLLDRAHAWLMERSVDAGRRWYLSAAIGTAVGAALVGGLLVAFRPALSGLVGTTAYNVFLAGCVGGVGAMASVAMGISRRPVDSRTGRALHLFDGSLRVVSGILGGVFLALVIHSRLLLAPLVDQARPLPAMLVLGFAAGFSERLVPNLVRRVEQEVGGDRDQGASRSPEARDGRRQRPT